ncbi:MAG: Gfo/Idh/MocA family oxidoreductase [Mucilaginibacter polytrichastri]|nr:Gfo/Idh/MocA family oxidoreductase [Mucilaginibacter polytrichastri]
MKKEAEKAVSSRRDFLKNTGKAAVAFTIIPRFVLGRGYTAPSDQLSIGFIGTGKQARGLVGNFTGIANVICGADVDKQKLALFRSITEKKYAETREKSSFKGFQEHADFRDILGRKDIDAVVIATPDHWHAAMSVLAAKAKKHIYCEKPLAHSVHEGRAMVDAVTKNKVVLQTGSMQRSWENFRKACELVRNGYIGKVSEVLVNVGKPAIPCDLPEEKVPSALNWDFWLGPASLRPFNAVLSPPVEDDSFPNWRNYQEYAGGILSDWGAHMFDIAQWALDKDESGPVKFTPPNGADIKHLTMLYDDGIVMKHQDFGRGWGVRFIGSEGKLDISREYLDSDPTGIVSAQLKDSDKKLYKSENHYQNWIDGIKTGKDVICNAETGHRTSSLCAIANITYRLNRELNWDPKKEQFSNDAEANTLLRAPMRKPWAV